MEIRNASREDWKALEEIERICFPEAEAASGKTILQRLLTFPGHFWILEQDGRALGFINGMVTDQETISDEQFENASLHREKGLWQTVFGLDVLPEYRRKGCGAMLMRALLQDAKRQGRRGCILTCKEELIPYYEGFGYECLGVSASVHGGVVWYDMRLVF